MELLVIQMSLYFILESSIIQKLYESLSLDNGKRTWKQSTLPRVMYNIRKDELFYYTVL